MALARAADSNPGNEQLRPASAEELRTNGLPLLPPVTQSGLLGRTPRIEVFGRETLPLIRSVSEPSILRSVTERRMPSLFEERPGRILTERPGRTIVGEPTRARSVVDEVGPGGRVGGLLQANQGRTVVGREEDEGKKVTEAPKGAIKGDSIKLKCTEEFCCVFDPVLNLDKSFKCGDIGSYNKEERERRKLKKVGIDLPGEEPPEWFKRTKAGPSENWDQYFFEAYCSVFFHGDCICEAEQSLIVGSDANDELVEEVLKFMTERYNRETKDNNNPKDSERVNKDWKPSDNIEKLKQYQDYIQPWVRCCEDRGSWYLGFVDGPGKYKKEAAGTIYFTAKFRSVQITPIACRNSYCWINYKMLVNNGKVSVLPDYGGSANNPYKGCEI